MTEIVGFGEQTTRFLGDIYKLDIKDGRFGNLFKDHELNDAYKELFGCNKGLYTGNLTANQELQQAFVGKMLIAESKNGAFDGDIFDPALKSLPEMTGIQNSSRNIFPGFLKSILSKLLLTPGAPEFSRKVLSEDQMIQLLRQQAYPYGDLSNYRMTPGDITGLEELGRNYTRGQFVDLNNTPELIKVLNDRGIYIKAEQISPEERNNIIGDKINTNLNPQDFGLTQEQLNNAFIIASVIIEECKEAEKSPEDTKRAMIIALATAMQESSLRNLPYGDRDSLGLFQQRPSCGWGSEQQVMDPVYATRKFADALLKTDYVNKEVTEAAQDVQRSAFPDAYAKHEPKVRALVEAMLSFS